MKKYLLLILLPIFLFADGHKTKYENPFQIVYGGSGSNIYGDYKAIASSVLCVNKDGKCNNTYSSYLFFTDTRYIKDVSTNKIPLNSSTKTLKLPSDINGSDIVYAGLYWQGHIAGTNANNYQTDTKIKNRGKVDLMDPNGVIHHITASKVWYLDFWGDGRGYNGGYRSFYQGYENITTIVQKSYTNNGQKNDFTVGDIKASVGRDHYQYAWIDGKSYNGFAFGYWGNWTLVVVYKYPNIATLNPRPKPKNITLFQGFKPLIPISSNGKNITKSITLPLSGFLTPAQTPIVASMFLYGAAGDKKLKYDSLQIQDKKSSTYSSISNTLNPINDAFNDSVTDFGTAVDSKISYYPGLDADTFDISKYMDTFQTTTILKLSAKFKGNSGDQFLPGFIAFSTDLYVPKFCYDYAYSQNGVYFTQNNDGTKDPRLVGSIIPKIPITMKIFLKNLVSSNLQVTNMNLSVLDLNTTQVNYIPNTTKLTPPNSLFASTVPSPPIITDSNDSFIKNIPIGTVPTQGYFYLYYNLNPKINDLNTSINITAKYNLHVGASTIPYSLTLGSQIPMCSSGDFNYAPAKGIFDIVDNDNYSTALASPKYYNIPTQVTSRDGNFKIISLDPKNLDTLKPQSAVVAVDMINAQAFHDVNASCDEPDSAISPRVWVVLDNTTNAPFTKSALTNAINNNMTTLQNSYDFYKEARRNAAFRVSYNTNTNGTLIGVTKLGTNSYKLTNFPAYGGQQCSPTYTGTQTTVSAVCGSNSNGGGQSAMTQAQLAQCMECIYGKDTRFVCSRDNFAIRPEAFLIDVNDQNQTNPTNKISLAQGTNPPPILNLASGYNYNLRVTATNHQNNSASPGFYTTLNNILDDNASYTWSPLSTQNISGCNDVTNHDINVSFNNGAADMNTSVSQVGRYQLSLLDSTWTDVDHNPSYMTHHTGSYFKKGADCIQNSSITQQVNANAINGCNISSDENNTDKNIRYHNINVLFNPYKFGLTSITPSIGLNHTTSDFSSKNSFVYMSNLAVPADENMSFHLNGQIKAEGENNATLSNFVSKCYAQPIDLNISKTNITTPPAFMYVFHDLNTSGGIISSTVGDLNNTKTPITLNDGNFTKKLKGTMQTILNLNFDRNQTKAQNPQKITFNDYTAKCQIPAKCSFKADLKDENTTGLLNLNKTVTFYYGRTHAPDYKFQGNSGNGLIYYEVYDNNESLKPLLPNGINTNVSVDGVNWYNNAYHIKAKDGFIGNLTELKTPPHVTLSGINLNTSPITFTLNYDGTQDYPYQTTMQNNPSGWLIYNPFNSTILTNQFNVGFYKIAGKWTGVQDTNTSTDSKAPSITTQRVLW